MKTTSSWLAGLVLAAATASAWGQTAAWDTLGPNNSYSSDSYWNVGSLAPGFNIVTADLFTPTVSGELYSATAAMQIVGDPIAPATFEIRGNNNGTPGAILASTVVPLTSDTEMLLYTGLFDAGVQLSTSSSYFFTVSETPGSFSVLAFNTLGVLGRHVFTGSSWQAPGSWFIQDNTTLAASRIMVNALAVPEPGTWALTMAGFAAILAARRRQVGA